MILFYPTAKFQHSSGKVIEIQDVIYRHGRQHVIYTHSDDDGQEQERTWESLERGLVAGEWVEVVE